MDALSAALAVGLGSLVGLATGLVPGLHVNTLVALTAGLLPVAGPHAALGLVAVGVVHTFVGILPATYLGAPGDDTALVVLPAHRLLQEGFGPGAVHLSAHASLLALVLAVALVLPYKWLLLEPGRGLERLDAATPLLVAGVIVLLVLQERLRGRRAVLGAASVLGLSGCLGLVAARAPVRALLDVPATPLLPLLAGLFGLPALLVALQNGAAVPRQAVLRRPLSRTAPRGTVGATLLGTGAAAWTAVLPGLTAAVATALTPLPRRDDPRPVVAALSAVNTAHATLALAVLWITGRPRTGLAQALGGLLPVTAWERGAPPSPLVWVLGAALAAGILGHLGTLALDRCIAARIHRVPPRALNAAGLVLVSGLLVVLSGPVGVMVGAVATLVGLLPLAFGIRRVHLVGALLVPVLIHAV